MGGWQITRKDLRLLLRDRRALAVLIMLPLIFITIIGLTTGQLLGWRSSNQILKIAYVVDPQEPKPREAAAEGEGDAADEEETDDELADPNAPGQVVINKNLITKVVNSLQQRRGLEMLPVDSIEVARKEYSQGGATAALRFGPHFVSTVRTLKPWDFYDMNSSELDKGLAALDLHLESEDDGSATHSIMEGYVHGTVLKQITPYVFCENYITRRNIKRSCEAIEAEEAQPPIALLPADPEDTGRDSGSVYDELIPSYTVLFVFFLVNIMARSFIHERDLGTLRRLRIAPLSLPGLLTGKTTPFYVISVLQTVTLFIVGRLLYGMSWGTQPWMLIPVLLATSLAATGLGLLVGTWVRTESQVSAYANIVVITMAGVSGCFMPREWLPDAMQTLSLATPHAWALMAYDEILTKKDPNPAIAIQNSAILVGFAAAFFIVGLYRFRSMK